MLTGPEPLLRQLHRLVGLPGSVPAVGLLTAVLLVAAGTWGGRPWAAETPTPPRPTTILAQGPGKAPHAPDEALPPGAVARVGSTRLRPNGCDSMVFAPDGRSLLSVSRDGTLTLWDVATGRRGRRFRVPGRWNMEVAFGADGRTLDCLCGDGDLEYRVLDVVTGQERRRVPLADTAQAFRQAVAPNASALAVALAGMVRLYSPATGKETARFAVRGPFPAQVRFRDDGKALIVADSSDTVRVHATADGAEVAALRREKASFQYAALSPDGRWAAATSVTEARAGEVALCVWDVATGRERHRFPGFGMYDVRFSPDGRRLLASNDQDCVLWDLASGTALRRFRTWTRALFAMSRDGKTLATSTGAITLWDVATGRTLPASADPPAVPNHLRFSPDGKELLGVADILRAWDPTTGREVRRFPAVGRGRVGWGLWLTVPLSPDGKTMATADMDGTIRLWDAETGKERRALKGHAGYVTALRFAPDGRTLVSVADDLTLRVWDAADGRELHRAAGLPAFPILAVSPDGKWLAFADRNGRAGRNAVHLWDLGQVREVRQLQTPPARPSALAFSPDSRVLASAQVGWMVGETGSVQVWDLATGKEWRTLGSAEASAFCLAFAPDGRSLAVCGWREPWGGGQNGHLAVWELASGRERLRFRGHAGMVLSVAFSPDGCRLAASSEDAPVYIWDVGGRRPGAVTLPEREVQQDWAELADADAAAAYQAIFRLAAAPDRALPFLRRHLRPVAAADGRQVRDLVQGLDSPHFAERERAAAELEKRGESAGPALRQALAGRPSLQIRRRVERLLAKLDPTASPERLREVRAVEALEHMATPAARQLLQELAGGIPDAGLTREAKRAVDRLAAHP